MTGLTELPFGLAGAIYRSPMPMGVYDSDRQLLQAYQQAKLHIVIMLSATGEDQQLTGIDLAAIYQQMGLEVIKLPITDYQTPSQSTLANVLEYTQQAARGGKNIVIHCSAGVGRTGTFMACLAKRVLGLDGEAAIQWVRQSIPGAIETKTQYQFVYEF